MSEELSKAEREEIHEMVRGRVEEAVEIVLDESRVNERAVEDKSQTIAERVIERRGGNNGSGRTNVDKALSGIEPETYTEEVPIEKGEDPETVEVERIESSGDPRLNGDLNSSEIVRAFREGLTPDMIQEKHRTNNEDTSTTEEQSNPEDVSEAGLPWYQ